MSPETKPNNCKSKLNLCQKERAEPNNTNQIRLSPRTELNTNTRSSTGTPWRDRTRSVTEPNSSQRKPIPLHSALLELGLWRG